MSTATKPVPAEVLIGQGPIKLIFRDSSRAPEVEPLCREVLGKFHLPQRSLICIFDDEERPEFTNFFGENYCGFFSPVGLHPRLDYPREILNHIWRSDEWDLDVPEWVCDVVIYLRRRTCDSQIGSVITFSHELQHFMQYGFRYEEWRAECMVREVSAEPLAPWRFPSEHEAQLVAKRKAEEVFGGDVIRAYAEKQIQETNDPEKWRFFQELDPAEPRDLLE